MVILKAVLMLFAGLGTFMIGLELMGKNLESFSGDKLRQLFTKISNKKILGIATGCFTTILTQSSSATTVMVVGFVNTGLMSLIQATAIIMGANIGTTATAYLIALQNLPVAGFFCALACVGVFMQMAKKSKVKSLGTILAGIGLLFTGLYVMSSSMTAVLDIKKDAITSLILSLSKYKLVLILIGTILTMILQSSAGTTSILIGLCTSGAMPLEPAFFVTLGMNVGTCITAIISSIGASTNAKRASMVHLLFNVIGTIIFGVILLIFGNKLMAAIDSLNIIISLKIAIFHTVFNVTTTVLMFPLMKQLTQLASLIIPESKAKQSSTSLVKVEEFKFVDNRLINTPAIAMIMLRKEITQMAIDAKTNLELAMDMLFNKNIDRKDEFVSREKHIDFLNKNLSKFLVKISNQQITYENEKEIAAYYHNISDIERIGDYAENIVEYAEELINSNVDFSNECKLELKDMKQAVYNEMEVTFKAFEQKSISEIQEVEAYEDLTDTFFNQLSENHIVRLNSGLCKAESASVFISLIGNLERIGDHTMNIFNSMKTYIK